MGPLRLITAKKKLPFFLSVILVPFHHIMSDTFLFTSESVGEGHPGMYSYKTLHPTTACSPDVQTRFATKSLMPSWTPAWNKTPCPRLLARLPQRLVWSWSLVKSPPRPTLTTKRSFVTLSSKLVMMIPIRVSTTRPVTSWLLSNNNHLISPKVSFKSPSTLKILVLVIKALCLGIVCNIIFRTISANTLTPY